MRDVFGNLLKREPISGKKFSKKQIKREILVENKQKGKSAEEMYKMSAMLQGKEVERSPHGRDFIEREKEMWTGKVRKTTHVEIKSSKTAPLSKLQKETRKKKKNYRIDRIEGFW